MPKYFTHLNPIILAKGKTITDLRLGNDDALHFVFNDGSKIKLFDDDIQCCEKRYMVTDDNLSEYIGAKFLGIEVKPARAIDKGEAEEAHEVQFLEVQTTNGVFTMVSHNEHNGFYNGFVIKAINDE